MPCGGSVCPLIVVESCYVPHLVFCSPVEFMDYVNELHSFTLFYGSGVIAEGHFADGSILEKTIW